MTYVPSWPPKPDPAFCLLCRTYQEVWSYLATKDLTGLDEIDMELKCGHRIVATNRKRGALGAIA